MRPALVIFDCDGVLVDSEPISNRLFVAHLNRAGFPFTLEECYRELLGRSMASCEALLAARFGRKLPEGFIAALQADTYAALAAEVETMPGVPAALDALEAAGLPYCVASSGEFAKMRATLGRTGLLPRFEGRMFSATQVARGKPHPDLFLHAAAEMRAGPARCAVIEDSVPGIRAAAAAGMRALGYAGGTHADAGGLAAEGAETFSEMSALPRLLGIS
ncbi:HAD family hydrolase [Desertibaculum subflavum]|uniref:HAD family hydrolase n=1 Tax=Desertibaculum subflavum TaxID=2268458 RepID=UPI000E671991